MCLLTRCSPAAPPGLEFAGNPEQYSNACPFLMLMAGVAYGCALNLSLLTVLGRVSSLRMHSIEVQG